MTPSAQLCGHDGQVLCLATDDEGCVISGGSDKLIKVWKEKEEMQWELLEVLEKHQHNVWSVCVIGDTYFSGSADCQLIKWCKENGKHVPVVFPPLHTAPVRSLAAQRGDVLSAANDGTLARWNTTPCDDRHDFLRSLSFFLFLLYSFMLSFMLSFYHILFLLLLGFFFSFFLSFSLPSLLLPFFLSLLSFFLFLTIFLPPLSPHHICAPFTVHTSRAHPRHSTASISTMSFPSPMTSWLLLEKERKWCC